MEWIRVRRPPLALALGLIYLTHAAAAHAQPATLEQVRALQARGEFAAAVRLLRDHLSTRPDDGEATRLLAQTLYWLQDVDAAREIYDAALERHPEDAQVRVDYAQMLVETGDRARARALLLPLAAASVRLGGVYALLGTLAYVEGDLTAAARRFEQALAIEPTHAQARLRLQEIRAASAPWVRFSPAVWHDDQPLHRRAMAFAAGWFLTPLTPISVQWQPSQYVERSRRSLWAVEVQLRHSAPRLRVDTEVAAGVLRRSVDGDRLPEWTGRGAIGVRLPGHLTLRGRVERAPYLHTTASLETRVAVDAASGEVHFDHPRGWLGQAAVQQYRYPDRNVVHTRYAWLLAPIVRSTAFDVQAGYAVSFEDAAESRYVPLVAPRPSDPVTPMVELSGRYAPYYTPARAIKHSLATAIRGAVTRHVQVRVGGSYGVHATEDAPVLFVRAGAVQRTFVRREFRPFEARAALEIRASDTLSIGMTAEAGRSVFYRWRTAGVQLTYRFADGTPAAGGAP